MDKDKNNPRERLEQEMEDVLKEAEEEFAARTSKLETERQIRLGLIRSK